MSATDIIRYQPWLRLCNINNISDRLLDDSKGDAFVAFNVIHNRYELHTISAFRYTGESLNAVIEDLNQFLIRDFRANNLKKYRVEVESSRALKEQMYSIHEEQRLKNLTELGLKRVEKLIGRDL